VTSGQVGGRPGVQVDGLMTGCLDPHSVKVSADQCQLPHVGSRELQQSHAINQQPKLELKWKQRQQEILVSELDATALGHAEQTLGRDGAALEMRLWNNVF